MLTKNHTTLRFIKEISEELNVDEKVVLDILTNFFNIIIDHVARRKVVFFWLSGFGKIYYRKYKKPHGNKKRC